MEHTRRQHLVFLGASAAAALAPAAGLTNEEPQVHVVEMLNADPENRRERQVFVPDIVRANVGDTIKFVSVNPGHNSACDEGGAPEGGTLWRSKIGDDFEVTIETPGAYAYYCVPHRTAGMVGLLLVGDDLSNYEDVKNARYRGKEKQRYEQIFARADEMIAEEQSA